MLENNNLKICSRLVWRDIKFHKARSILLMAAIALVCMLYTFSFALGGMIRDGYIYTYKMTYGSDSHIIFYDLNRAQAAALRGHVRAADSVTLSAIGILSDDMLEYRSVKLAAVSSGWAEATDAVPLHGRMPEEKGEIALDELTMNSLAIPYEIGTEERSVRTLSGYAAGGTVLWDCQKPVHGSRKRQPGNCIRVCWNRGMCPSV